MVDAYFRSTNLLEEPVFCCVMSYVLLRLMQHKACSAGLSMSAKVLVDELADLKEVIMIYDDGRAQRAVTSPSSIQKRLYELFNLGEIEKTVTLHEAHQIHLI